ncbi:unnamed protein product [Rangifer tarandus platyrhynchus]|uniref:Uncharacterized protein n=1 Tax=Rangifer tarandus platyrhynchus TaxID=3082113 RepID=A0AC59ZVV2_RANTA
MSFQAWEAPSPLGCSAHPPAFRGQLKSAPTPSSCLWDTQDPCWASEDLLIFRALAGLCHPHHQFPSRDSGILGGWSETAGPRAFGGWYLVSLDSAVSVERLPPAADCGCCHLGSGEGRASLGKWGRLKLLPGTQRPFSSNSLNAQCRVPAPL